MREKKAGEYGHIDGARCDCASWDFERSDKDEHVEIHMHASDSTGDA
jgi:hypothetical protein